MPAFVHDDFQWRDNHLSADDLAEMRASEDRGGMGLDLHAANFSVSFPHDDQPSRRQRANSSKQGPSTNASI